MQKEGEAVINLSCGDYSAIINPQRGANCISLRNKKYNAVILREPKQNMNLDNPYLYGMPVLYPVNRIFEGKFEFDGHIYTFPINEPDTNCHLHGFLHETEFEVEAFGKDFVKCVFTKPYFNFPHKFRMEITYNLSEHGLKQTTKITNLSEKNMPNFLGFHTTFNVPFISGSDVSNIRLFAEIGEEIERNEKHLPTGKIFSCTEITEKINKGNFIPSEKVISCNCKAINNGKIELKDIKKHIKLIYENDKKFGWRLFYNGNASEYICLEPMTCTANCQNAPFEHEYSGFDSIPPHKSREYISKIYLKEE